MEDQGPAEGEGLIQVAAAPISKHDLLSRVARIYGVDVEIDAEDHSELH